MADSSRTIMTDAGFALEARIRAGQTKIEFTRASISTADHFKDTDDVLAKLTVLDDVQQDGQVTDVQVIDDTTVHVQVDIDQTKAPADYEMRSAGLYAKDDDGAEVLYGVTVLQDPVYVHKDDDGSYLGFGIDTAVGRSASVTVKVNPANMVTQQAFETTMASYYTKSEVDAKFVTDDDFASKLPKNIATTDAANTFAKSQTLAGGATDGKGNAYATTKDVTTDLNNGLSTKVTDNKNGTEQLNGVKVQPFNKLSDTVGGRNLLKGTSGTLQTVTNASGWFTNLPIIPPVVTKIDSDTTYTARAWISPASHDTQVQVVWTDPSGTTYYVGGNTVSAGTSGYSTWTETIAAGSTIQRVSIVFDAQQSEPSSVSYKEMKFEKGNVATDWTPAPEDKVNVTDMRKPASDVAGIEEVNALQTQVDNSAVGTNLLINSNFSDESLTYWTVDTGMTSSFDSNGNLVLTVVNATENNRIYYSNQILDAGTTYAISFYAYVDSSSTSSSVNVEVGPYDNLTSIAVSGTTLARYTGLTKPVFGSGILTIAVGAFNSGEVGDIVHITKIKLEKGSVATDWCLNPSEILTKADDSKVAHLSGANNFDTVPTVNDNPLLLASSLPSDLARTGQDANFTGKLQQNGQDVALANNTIDRNPNTGVVSEPVDFTKLTVEGGKSVATSDDLKSLREGSWLSLGTPLGEYLDITSSELVDTTFTGEPLFMKFDSATGTTKLSGGLLFSPIKDLNGHATWTGQLVTLPDGFDVSDDDVKSFITLLLNSNSTAFTTLDSVTKSGQVISGTITYTGRQTGFKEGISLVGSVGANYRQYVTNLTTKLIKKI